MTDSTPRFIFAGFCVLCLTAIWCGALFEIGRQKRGGAISKRHFRWRMISVALWTLILGALAFATLRFWPESRADIVNARRFLAITSTAIALLLPAFLLLIFDFYLTAQTRRLQTARANQDLGEIARFEIERAQAEAKMRAQNPESGEKS